MSLVRRTSDTAEGARGACPARRSAIPPFDRSPFLTGRGKPLPVALQAAAESGNPFHGNLVHAVHFWMTGEVVRRVLEGGGEAGYTPSMYALGLFDGGAFRSAIESTWPAYLDGKKTLSEAANDLLETLRQATGPQ